MFAQVVVVLLVVLAVVNANVHDRSYYESKFFDWLSTHNVKPTGGEHFVQMLQNYANNDDIIEAHNAQGLSYTLGHNAYSGMSLEEWRQYVHLGLTRPEPDASALTHAAPADVSALPASVNWQTAGKVTPVKDQGQCGSCWSFSTTGALEGAYSIKYNTLTSFSEQNLVDCDTRQNGGKDMGCNGGLMDSAFAWTKKNGGICTEATYPYVSGTTKKSGTCNTSCAKVANVAPKSFTDVQTNSVSALKSALAQQPVSIAIEADQSAFQLYKSGVFTGKCGANLDHGVLAVGYGTESGLEYFLVKNSWGESWGSGGYIKLAITGITAPEGQCGILAGPPSYPNL